MLIKKITPKKPVPRSDKDGEHLKFSFIAGRNAKWYRHFGKPFSNSLEN